MPLNLELKIPLSSLKKIKENLEKINAQFVSELKQKDVYYKVPSGLLKLRIENGSQWLIKYNRDEKSKNRFSDFSLLNVDKGAEKFFAGTLKIIAEVEKVRELYMFNNTRIHLDKVKKLGTFLELETLVVNGKEDAKKRFDEIIKLLQLDTSKQFKKSYKDLIIKNDSDKK